MHGFLKQYGATGRGQPSEHIWIYDEAQRAWDADRVSEKRGHSTSEPEDFLRIGERMQDWALMIGLIGEGQEIHLGEEAGLIQWNNAIRAMQGPWTVHAPQHTVHLFDAATRVVPTAELNLDTSLRSHIAEHVQDWVRALLDGDLEAAANLAPTIEAAGFCLYVTRNVDSAKAYVRERYQEYPDYRFGLMASSKAKNLTDYGIRNDYGFTKNVRFGPWYNASPDDRNSCCQLNEVVTEFGCQGLELDMPIVGWGNDLKWNGTAWVSVPQPRSAAHSPHQLRLNSYRVLLTRGRDGFIVFVPPATEMDATYSALLAAGLAPKP